MYNMPYLYIFWNSGAADTATTGQISGATRTTAVVDGHTTGTITATFVRLLNPLVI